MRVFIIISSFYILCLSLLDGLFNRLIFREHRKHPYDSSTKKKIYTYKEWKYIGVILLIILPLLIPLSVSWIIGGLKYVLIYLAIFSVIQWDIIFGKLVFDDWFGDTPSIALPKIGWIRINLFSWIVGKLIFLLVILLLLWLIN